jgi:hypothetical protein
MVNLISTIFGFFSQQLETLTYIKLSLNGAKMFPENSCYFTKQKKITELHYLTRMKKDDNCSLCKIMDTRRLSCINPIKEPRNLVCLPDSVMPITIKKTGFNKYFLEFFVSFCHINHNKQNYMDCFTEFNCIFGIDFDKKIGADLQNFRAHTYDVDVFFFCSSIFSKSINECSKS